MDYERLLLDNLDTVEKAVQYVARRYCLSEDDRDELRAAIHLKLIERDYEVLRQFQQHSTLRTYLTAIVLRHFLDERNARWGKWRPSRVARKLGGTAVRLDELLNRDGRSLNESIELLRTNHGVQESPLEIANLASQLPRRVGRHFVGEEALEGVPAAFVSSSVELDRGDAQDEVGRIEAGLLAALEKCTDDDLLILQYHFDGGLQVVTIARLMGLPPKPLYRRLEKLLQRMHAQLEAHGVSHERTLQMLREGLVDFRPILQLATVGKKRAGSSNG